MPGRSLTRELERLVDRPHVLSRPADLAAYAFDSFGASGDRYLPHAVVFPGSADEVAAVVQLCAIEGIPVVPRGAATGYCGGAVALRGGVMLSTVRLNRLGAVDTSAMRLRAGAGVITATLQQRATEAGCYYPPDPGSMTTSTMGGNVACNAAGPHALRYGTTGDFVTAATAVLANGEIVQLAEAAGGGSLLRLLCGSEGTLGVLTEVEVRLLPSPEARTTIAATFADMTAAGAAVARIAEAGLVPAALEFMDEAALNAVRLAGSGDVPEAGALVLVELEGLTSAVKAEVDTVRTALDAAGAATVEHADDAVSSLALWAIRKAISAAVAKVQIGKVNEDVVVPRDRLAELVAAVHRIGGEHSLPAVTFGHLGDGNLHCSFLIDPRRPGERARADAAADALFETVLGMDGVLTGEHGVGYTKLPWVERQLGTAGVDLMRRIKDSLDIRGTLNPGKKVPAAATPMNPAVLPAH